MNAMRRAFKVDLPIEDTTAPVRPVFAGYVPKPIQLELRRAWRLIHIDGKYEEGMKIIIDMSGMPENRIDWKALNPTEVKESRCRCLTEHCRCKQKGKSEVIKEDPKRVNRRNRLNKRRAFSRKLKRLVRQSKVRIDMAAVIGLIIGTILGVLMLWAWGLAGCP